MQALSYTIFFEGSLVPLRYFLRGIWRTTQYRYCGRQCFESASGSDSISTRSGETKKLTAPQRQQYDSLKHPDPDPDADPEHW
jgi:hypothetical protein